VSFSYKTEVECNECCCKNVQYSENGLRSSPLSKVTARFTGEPKKTKSETGGEALNGEETKRSRVGWGGGGGGGGVGGGGGGWGGGGGGGRIGPGGL